MRTKRPFVNASWTAVIAMVLLPSLAILLELLKAGFSQSNMTTGSFVHFPTLHSYLTALGFGRLRILSEQIGRAFVIATLDLLIAVPAAHFLVRRVLNQKRRMIILVILLLPFFVNSATKAFSWKFILGYPGPISTIMGLIGLSESARHSLLYNPWAVGVSLISSSLPLALFAVAGFMSAMPESVWSLCDDLGLDSANELLFVALPATLKGVTVGWIASFVVCALASHEIDFTGGVQQTSLSKAVNNLFNERDPNAAMAMGVLFVCAIIATVCVGRILLAFAKRLSMPSPLRLGRLGLGLEGCCLGLTFLIILAPAVSVLAKTTGMISLPHSEVSAGVSRLTDDAVTDALRNTSAVALLVTIPTVVGAVITALSWWNPKAFQTILIVTLCLAAVPGNSYAMGLFFLARALHLSGQPILLVVISQVTWVFPFILLTVASGYAKIQKSALDAARDLGASSFRAFVSIILPLCWPEIILSGIVGTVLSMNDAARATFLSDKYQVISEYIVYRLGSGGDVSDYLLASLSVCLGSVVVAGFIACIMFFHSSPKDYFSRRIIVEMSSVDGVSA